MQNLLIISGPTASGKSALALKLANDLRGEIVNIDSVQVYQDFEIGSAKPSRAEQAAIRHHLLDLALPTQRFNVARYINSATPVIEELFKANTQPILVGGSTLYITSLLHGLAKLPQADPELRAKLEQQSSQELFSRLSMIDPEAAKKLHPNDRVRVMRAIEASTLGSGQSSKIITEHAHSERRFNAVVLVPTWARSELYARIDLRVKQMLQAGLLKEAALLLAKWGEDASPFRSLGYAEALECLKERISADALEQLIAMNSRRFAKRQMTYWRNEPLKRNWIVRPSAQEPARTLVNEGRQAVKGVKVFRALDFGYEKLLGELKPLLEGTIAQNQVWFVAAKTIFESLGLN